MRIKLSAFIFFATSLAISAFSQTATGGAAAGGGASGASGTTSSGAAATTGSAQIRSQTTQNGVVQPRQVLPGQTVLPSNQPGFGVASNQFNPNNQFGAATNSLLPGTNQFLAQSNGIMSQTNPALIAGAAQTNGLRFNNGTNLPAALRQDRAINGADRTLLVQIHRNLRGMFPSPTTLAGVHFQVQQGTVTVVGAVQTPEQKQRVLQSVQATPNVTQVVDQLQVALPGATIPAATVGAGVPRQALPNNNTVPVQVLTPTGVTNQFGINPNLAPPVVPQVTTNSVPRTAQ